MADKKLMVALAFDSAEVWLFRAGAAELFCVYARSASYRLDERGGIPPYEFFVKPPSSEADMHLFIGQEL
jgi:hypothetical protein